MLLRLRVLDRRRRLRRLSCVDRRRMLRRLTMERFPPSLAEILEVSPARRHEGMVRGERRGGDRVRSPIAALRLVVLIAPIIDDAEVVKRVGEIRMMRTEVRFLQSNSLTQ